MVEPSLYKTPDDLVRQGDIVRLGPSLRALKAIVHVGPQTSGKGGQSSATLLATPTKDVAEGRKDTQLIVPAVLSWGVLLTRGCDIENGRQRQLVGLRPMSVLQSTEAKESVILGKHSSLHYMPKPGAGPGGDMFEESFLDFRFVITMHSDAFNKLERPIAMTRDGLLDVYFSWMRHTIGPQVKRVAPCPACKTEIEIFHVVEELLRPPPDY